MIPNLDKGSVSQVTFIFGESGETQYIAPSSTVSAVIPNAIKFTYNQLQKGKGTNAEYSPIGQINLVENESMSDRYVFTATPVDTYVLDGSLKASWVETNGSVTTKELTKSGNKWVLENASIPQGALITVSCTFKDDFRDFKTEGNISNGTVTLYDKQVKAKDTPKISVEPKAGYSVKDITVTYIGGSGTTTTLTKTDGKIKQVNDSDGNPIEGLYEFTIGDKIMSGSDVKVTAVFEAKTIGLYAGENDTDRSKFVFSEYNVAIGDKVTVKPNDDSVKNGYKVTKITVYKGNTEVASSTNGSFTIPSDKNIGSNDRLTVKVETGLKEIELKEAKLTNGTVKAASARADKGETVTVDISPADGYRIKPGTLKAVIRAKDGTYSSEVYMDRKNDKTYTFIMPADIDPQKTEVSFTGEFVPGESDTSRYNTSLGAGIAVTVANSGSRAEAKGTAAAGGSVTIKSAGTGSIKTEAKAGYSKTNNGFAGGIAVQVASVDSRALVYKSADIKLNGTLKVASQGKTTFSVTGDASGKKGADAKGTGVGSGIAVAVNGSDSIAAVEDGAKVAANNNKQLKGISVTATQKLTDTVSAKAGAAGGTAVVPVAAVDVMGGSANAYLGKVAGNLTVSGNVAVSAKNETEHTISADASAVGKGAGIGVAIAVSVLSDEARARLNQSVKAGQVTVAAETVAKVTETATAGAEGGNKDGKSADQKADGLLSGAAKLAAKNKSSAVSGGKVDKAVKDRQKAETSEGTVGAAGAVAVNVQSSISHAEIMNGVNVDASGLVSVTAVNGTTSKVKANASATNSNIGIGVGAAVNVITLNNIAHIGDGQIKAAMLAVSATTKEAKNQNKVVQKVSTTDGLTRQVTDMVKEYVGKLFTEMGLDKYGLSKELMEKLAGEVTNAVADTLVKATGLSSLLGDGDITKKYEAALKKLTSSKDGLMGLPDKLIDPFMEVMNDVYDLSGLTADQLKKLKSSLLSTFTTQLKTQLTQSGNGVLDGVKEGMHDYLKENGADLLSGIFSGKFKENTQKVFAQAKEELGKAVKKQLKAFVINTFQETIKAVDIPGVTQKNLNALGDALQGIQNAYTEKSIDNILSTACGYITDTFKQEVFDYEKMITSLFQTDFSAKIGETLRAAAKNASVALTNTAIAALTDHYDLKLSAQSDPTGHVIDTQAVSGAGAKDVGIAGSVAITVLNAETRADIAKSGNMISVTNGMTVDAKEVRNVKNVASAALDANGDASANKAAGAEANADVAGKNKTVYGVHATLETAAGATVEISEADKNLDKPVFHVILQDGFKMPDKVNYTYTDTDGKEKTGTIGFTKSGNEYLVDPKSGDLAGLDTKRDVRLMLTPVEELYTLPAPKVDTSVAGADKAVSLAVKGREAENGSYSARTGDVVELKIQKAEGRKVDSVGYSYTDENGKTHNVRIVTDESQVQAGQDVVYALRKGNGKEAIYEIAVPKGKITAFDVKIVAGEEDPEDSDTAAKDGSGKSVGVGAAFSMVYGDTKTTAEVGARSALTTGDLTVKAASDHTEKIASAAGSDPLQGAWDPDQTKNFSLDASVALNILDTAVKASVSESTNEAKVNGALSVTADENAVTDTAASAFSVGGSTAVGASVALNIANSKVNADMLTDAVVDNDVKISATTHSEDVTNAIASAMGGDIGRNMAKIGKAGDKVESGANKLLDGSYVDSLGKTDKKSTKTNDRINGRLDEKGNGDTKAKASTSTNALRSLGVSTADGNAGSEGTDAAKQKIEDTTDTKLGSQDAQKSSKIQVGAAVGVTVASHEAGTSVGAIKSYTGNVEAIAKNTSNFATLGTGAAMSLAEKANSIAVGVAVTVNNNKSNANAKGDIAAEGDVTLSSELTQNMDGDFRGRLAAQSLAGSVAGKDSSVSLGGAVSVVVANAQSTVGLAGSTDVAGRNVTVEATDKSKLAARAGGLSISKGSSIGMGIASTTIVSNNEVKATVGDNVEITADSFRLNAEKKQVKDSDFKQLIDLRTLVTDSSALSDEQRKKAKTGFIDVHKGKSDNSYKVEVNLSQEKLLGTLDGLNFLSSQNTYAEAIAGSVATGSTNASLAGSFAVATNNNKIAAQLGSNVTISAANGNADVSAVNGATTRVIAGSLSAAPAKTSVGATVAVLVNNDSARAVTGDNARVKASGNMSQKAEQTGNTQVFTGALSVAAGKEAGNAVGGAVNVIVNKSTAESIIGKKANISVGGAADISSKTDLDLMLISGSANVSVGPKASIAAGGTVNVIVDKAVANTTLGENNTVEADKVDITSSVIDRMISGAMSASAAISPNGKAGAGAVNVIISNSAADTTVGSKASLKAVSGDMRLKADNDAGVINATLAASGSGGAAIGGSFNVNVFDREAAVKLTDGTLNAGGNLSVQAGGKNYNILAGLALAGSVGGSSITGNADVLVESSRIHTDIEKGVTAKAGKNALLESYLSDFTVGAAGSIALGGGAAVGATVLTVVKNNDVRTRLGTSSVTGSGPDAVKSLSGEDVKGIFVGANAKETQFLGAAGVAVSGSAAVNGVVDVLVNNNTVLADASRAKLTSGAVDTENVPQIEIRIITYDRYFSRTRSRTVKVDAAKAQAYIESELAKANDQFSISADVFAKGQWLSYKDGLRELTTPPGAVTVKATDDTRQIVLAGGVSAASSAGVGASVVTLVSGKTVKALAHDMTATDDIKVIAENRDDITQAAVSVGIAGTAAVQLGAAVQVLGSKAVAEVGSDVISRSGSVNINSQNTTKLINAAGAIAGSGAAAVTPVGVVTYFTGESEARLKSGSIVDAQKNVNIRAEAVKDVDLYSAGFAVGGAAGVSGTANVLVSKDKTKAVAEEGTRTAADNMNVEAEGNYKLISATGVIAGGTAGVGINAVVSVLKSNTTAEMGGTALLNGSMNVKADSKRDVTNAGANLSVGAAGVGVNVMVLVAGTKMSQDAADMLTKGGSDNKGLNADTLMSQIASADKGGSKYYKNSLNGKILAEDTAGNGHYESKQGIGGQNGSGDKKQGTFDASTGYRSEDFDNEKYDDNAENQRGEKLETKDNSDIAAAKKVNTYTYTNDPDDAVIARITENAQIDKVKDVTVISSQQVTADLFGATVGAGAVGVAASAAVAMLRSNVLAGSNGTVRNASGNVSVTAESKSGGKVKDRSDDIKKFLKDLDPANGGIRAIGVTGAAGAVGVAVGAAVVLTDNMTQAALGGTVNADGKVNVNAVQDYDHITSAVGTASAGAVAVGASVAVAQSNGTVNSKINDKTTVKSGSDVNVTSTGNQNVTAVAATAGAGLVAVNAGVALSINRMTQNTGIGSGASITARNITVKAGSDTTADSGLVGVSIGGVGVALGAAVSQVDAKLNTNVENATLKATNGKIEVFNDAISKAVPKVFSLAGGGVAAGGNVLLSFNETISKARVANSTINAGTLDIAADLQGDAVSKILSAQAGGIAAGVSVNVADMRADNRAVLENSSVTVDRLEVHTGRDSHASTTAEAATITGGLGFAAISRNAAIARNNTKSFATVSGGSINAKTNAKVSSKDTVKADASVHGVQISGLNIAGNTVVALNDADTRVTVKTDTFEVKDGKAEFGVEHRATTDAGIETGGGSIIEGSASVSAAYGRSSGIIDVYVKKLTAGSLTAAGNTSSVTNAKVTNGSFAALKANAMVGVAYEQGVYNTRVNLGHDSSVGGQVDVTTDYVSRADADVTPHKGGLDASLLKMSMNLALARNTAFAGSDLVLDGAMNAGGDVNIKTVGDGSAKAVIRPVKVEVGGAKLAANFANADNSLAQAATLHMNSGTLGAEGKLNIQALSRGAEASASLGTAGADRGTSVSLANLTVSRAYATENLSSTAGIFAQAGDKFKDWDKLEVTYQNAKYKFWSNGYYDYATVKQNIESGEWTNVRTTLDGQSILLGGNGAIAPKKDRADVSDNNVNVAELNILSAMNDENLLSKSSATSNGAKEISFLTLGNLEAKSTASDSFSAALQGAGVTVKGKAEIRANTKTSSYAFGGAPGGYAMISGGISNTYANIGSEKNRQTAQALIGEGVKLTANEVVISASNRSETEAGFEKKGGYSLASIGSSSQPTETWRDTSVIIGQKAEITSKGKLSVESASSGSAKSIVNNSSTGLILNVATMQGKNTLNENVNLLIGEDVKIKADGEASLKASGKLGMEAASNYTGDFTVVNRTSAKSENILNRTQNLMIGKGVQIEADRLSILSEASVGDEVKAQSSESTGSSMLDFVKTEAANTVKQTNTLDIGPKVKVTANGLINISAVTGGNFVLNSLVNAQKGLRLVAKPEAHSNNVLTINNYTNINAGRSSKDDRTYITSRNDEINVYAVLRNLMVSSNTSDDADGAIGGVYSWANVGADYNDQIWVDDTTFRAGKRTLLETNHNDSKITALSSAGLHGFLGAGFESPTAKIWGTIRSVIRSSNTDNVDGGDRFEHTAKSTSGVAIDARATGSWWSKGNRDVQRTILGEWFCDFCRHTSGSFGDDRRMNIAATLDSAFTKALKPIREINRMVLKLDSATKARYGEEEYQDAERLYVFDIEKQLGQNATFDEARLEKYRLWTDALTQHNLHLLPNAARLYRTQRLDYVADVIHGDVLGDGTAYDIDIITALNEYAFNEPVIPIGSSGSLDFATGTLKVPAYADFDLYLGEVSGKWLLECFNKDFMRRQDVGQSKLSVEMLNAYDVGNLLANSSIISEVMEGSGKDGWKRYWLGHTPETADDPNESLIYLLLNEETDEVDAFRTSRAMIENGRADVDVSLFIFRDSRSDRMGEEKYNVLFIDTPAGEKSFVKVMTNVLDDRELEVPKTMRVILRGVSLGADYPAYSLTDHFMVLNNGTDGVVSMFDDFYHATFDGDVFDSGYTRIEGIQDNDLTITLTEGQKIWPEWIDDHSAEDIEGDEYTLVDHLWYNTSEAHVM
ncbi:MAG: hypothetical protein IJ242_12745 [Clostridia bacterium]|nr:hypothetical protein [Clostridia bacterium]